MATISFDTHKVVRTFEAAGFSEQQAEAFISALKGISADAEIATKRGIERLESKLEARFERIDCKLTLVQWMLALVVAAEVVPILAKLFQ